MARAFQALTKEEIIYINRQMLQQFGAISFYEINNNLLNPGSLEYVLAACQGLVYGEDLYPTIVEKAAAVSFRIITRHVFQDGNKRTGLEVCRQLLELNNYKFVIDHDVVAMVLSAAKGEVSEKEYIEWVQQRATLLE